MFLCIPGKTTCEQNTHKYMKTLGGQGLISNPCSQQSANRAVECRKAKWVLRAGTGKQSLLFVCGFVVVCAPQCALVSVRMALGCLVCIRMW